MGCVVNAHGIRFVMNLGRALLPRSQRVEDSRQDLVIYHNQRQCTLGDLQRFGRDDRHPIAHMAHLAVERRLIVRVRLRVALPTAGVQHARYIVVGQHRVDAFQRARGRGVNRTDAGMGVGTGEQRAVQHTGQRHVIGEDRAPLGQLDRIHFGLCLVDDSRFRLGNHHSRQVGAGQGIRGPAIQRIVRKFGYVIGRRLAFRGRQAAARRNRRHLHRRDRFPAQNRRRAQHRLHRARIAGATAEHARNGCAHLFFTGSWILIEQRLGRQQLGGGAEAALDSACFDKGALQRMQRGK